MSKLRRLSLSLDALLAAATSIELARYLGRWGGFGFVGKAEARVGWPLTPVSVAGVGRRTMRRCASGANNC